MTAPVKAMATCITYTRLPFSMYSCSIENAKTLEMNAGAIDVGSVIAIWATP